MTFNDRRAKSIYLNKALTENEFQSGKYGCEGVKWQS